MTVKFVWELFKDIHLICFLNSNDCFIKSQTLDINLTLGFKIVKLGFKMIQF